MSPTRGVYDVTIESNSADYDEARWVAEDYLKSKLAHPSTKFIMLEPAVAHSQDEAAKEGRFYPRPVREDASRPVDGKDKEPSGPPPQAPFSGSSAGRGERVGQ
jgi:hypothetical protein